MTLLSVIIPAYNCLADVLRCKMSLERYRFNTDRDVTEVLIQDDASPDYDGPELFGICCQRNPVNLGFPGNCNAGARRAYGNILLFLNQDCLALTPNFDRVICDFFDGDPEVGIVGPTLLFPDGRVQSVGGRFDLKCQPYHEFLGASNLDWEPISVPRRMSWVTGAALAIRRELWEKLGGFDFEYGRGYFEDADLCIRAQLLGAQVWHLPTVRFQHRVGSTGGNPHFSQNAQLFKRRWVDTGVLLPDVQAVKERFW